jgi:hypothetical protein
VLPQWRWTNVAAGAGRHYYGERSRCHRTEQCDQLCGTGGSGFWLFDIDATTGAVTVKSGAVLIGSNAGLHARSGPPMAARRGVHHATLTISLNDLFENAPPVITARPTARCSAIAVRSAGCDHQRRIETGRTIFR